MTRVPRLSVCDIQNILFESDNEDVCESDNEDDVPDDISVISDSTSEFSDGESCSDEEDVVRPITSANVTQAKGSVWKWTSEPNAADIPEKVSFSAVPGITTQFAKNLSSDSIELDFFRSLVAPAFWASIAKETNRYATQYLNLPSTKITALLKEWFETDGDEIQAYFSLCILMAQVKKSTLQSYWGARVCTSTPFFGQVMSYRRFMLLSKFLHFIDNNKLDETNRLGKIEPVVKYLNKNFQDMYVPEERVGLDESLMKFRGRLCYVQYNPSKRARFGIKFYKLCQSSNGYCVQFSIYTGKRPGNSGVASTPASEAIVLQLMGPYLDFGYTIFLDNWYTSPTLFLKLTKSKTNAIGTVRINRKQLPKELKAENLKLGEAKALFSHKMMVMKWIDKKPVHVLSTYHTGIEMTDTGKVSRKTKSNVVKPKAILEYNLSMNAVDRQDQQLASFPVMRRYAKGYKKIFFYIMDISIYNSYVMYKMLSGKKLHFAAYRVNLAEQILENVKLPEYKRRGRPSIAATPVRLQASNWGHFARHIPPNPIKEKPTRVCYVCKMNKKKSESRFECDKCLVALHMPDCFKLYHTQRKL